MTVATLALNLLQYPASVSATASQLQDSITTGVATNVTYHCVNTASADGSPAIYRKGTPAAPGGQVLVPSFTITSRNNAARTARRTSFTFRYPYGVQVYSGSTPTGVYKKVGEIICDEKGWFVPNDAPAAIVAQASVEYMGLLMSQDMRTTLISGYAPS